MKVALLGLLAPGAIAHFSFPSLIIHNEVTERFKYVRNVTVAPQYGDPIAGTYAPLLSGESLNSPDMRCGRNAFDFAATTDVLDVIAGEGIGFKAYVMVNDPNPPYYTSLSADAQVSHLGPAQVYMSKSPTGNVREYRGDGEWFKVAYWGPLNDSLWMPYDTGMNSFNFTIPPTTPPGEYLMRMEFLYPRRYEGESQFFISCAQIKLTNPNPNIGDPTVNGTAKFPGTYTLNDPGIKITHAQMYRPFKDLLKYVAPGPPVWEG